MSELTLSLEDDFWTVGDKLIDKLDKLVNLPGANTDLATYKQHLFPEENLLLSQMEDIQRHIDRENGVLQVYQQEADYVDRLKTLYIQKGKKEGLELQKMLKDIEVQEVTKKLTTLQTQLAKYDAEKDAENDKYKQLLATQKTFRNDLAAAQQGVINLETSIATYDGLDAKIQAENQRLRQFRQTNYQVGTVPYLTSLSEVITDESLVRNKQSEVQLTLNDYAVKMASVDMEAKNVSHKYASIRVKMGEKLAVLKQQQALSKKNKKNVDFEVLHEAMTDMAEVTPGMYKEIIQDVTQNMTAAEYDKKRQRLKATMNQKFAMEFDKPGSKHEVEVEVEVGAGVSAGIASARGTFIATFSLKVAVDDNKKYTVTKALAGKVKIRGRAGVSLTKDEELKMRAAVEAAIKKEGAKTYANRDDFVEGESAGMSAAFVSYSLSNNVIPSKEFKNMKTQQKAIVHQEAAIVGREKLESRLRMTGMLTTDQQITVPARKQITYVRSSNLVGSAAAQASAAVKFANDFGVGGSVGIEASYTRKHKQKVINLIDDIAQHPTLGKLYSRQQPDSFGFVLTEGVQRVPYKGQQAIEKLEEIEAQVDSLQKEDASDDKEQKLLALRTQMKKCLESLSLEYQTFVQAENRVETGNANFEENLRNDMRKARDTKDSANYLKAVSLQYANLRRVYDKSFTDANPPDPIEKDFMDGFEQDLKCPQFKISPDKFAKVFNIDQNTLTTEVTSVGGSFSIDGKYFDKSVNNLRASIPSVRLGIKYSNTHPPDGDDSEEMALTFNVMTGVKGDNFVAKLLQFSQLKQIAGFGANKQEIENGILAAVQSAAAGNLEVKLHRKAGGWHIKYVRGYEVSDKKVGGKGTVANVGGVDIIAGGTIGTTHTTTIFERPGVNSLSYVTDIYRARKLRSRGVDDWKLYDKQHKLLDRMVANLKNADSNISKELNVWFKEMGDLNTDEGNALIEEARQKLTRFRTGNNPETADTEEAEFREVFEKFIAKRTTDEDAYVNKQFHTRRTAQLKDMRVYAAEVIADRMQKIVNEHDNDVSDDDAKSVDNLLAWAKKKYKLAVAHREANQEDDAAEDALQKSFKTLKSVFGIQYATNTLEELISSGKAENQNKALSMLDTEIDAILKDQANVYLDKGLTGELTMEADGKLKIKPQIAKGKANIFTKEMITNQVQGQLDGFRYEALPTTKIDSRNMEAAWQQSAPSRQDSHRFSRLASRSMRSLQSHVTRNKKISQYISQVMEKALLERRRRQEQQKKARANAAAANK